MKKRVYGPVPSRRFGRSLGVDVVSYKACSLDCVYCQLGHTTMHTSKREMFYPVEEVLKDIEEAVNKKHPDVITFAGSGEPTLYLGLGDVIKGIKQITDIPVVLLTNGTLLWQDEVAEAVAMCDVVAPSLDAGDEETFIKVNRPANGIEFSKFIQGLIDFRMRFLGTLRLEVFLVAGITDNEEALHKIAGWIPKIRPDFVDINTAVRPTPNTRGLKVDDYWLVRAQQIFGENAAVIASFRKKDGSRFDQDEDVSVEDVLESLQRRPQSVIDLAQALNAHPQEVIKCIAELSKEGLIESQMKNGETFWLARDRAI